MNYDNLFVFPNGRTARNEYIPALIVLALAFAFYFFIVAGRNSQWCQLTLLFPALMLHARRLHDMGKTAWLVVIPGALLAATSFIHLCWPDTPAKTPVAIAAAVVATAFVVWGLIGKSKA